MELMGIPPAKALASCGHCFGAPSLAAPRACLFWAPKVSICLDLSPWLLLPRALLPLIGGTEVYRCPVRPASLWPQPPGFRATGDKEEQGQGTGLVLALFPPSSHSHAAVPNPGAVGHPHWPVHCLQALYRESTVEMCSMSQSPEDCGQGSHRKAGRDSTPEAGTLGWRGGPQQESPETMTESLSPSSGKQV